MREHKNREEKIRRWYDMWIQGECADIDKLFEKNLCYTEASGAEYHRTEQLARWFEDWHKKGAVTQFKITSVFHDRNHTIVEWHFEWIFKGEKGKSDGVSIVEFSGSEKIFSLKEFCAASSHTLPYGV